MNTDTTTKTTVILLIIAVSVLFGLVAITDGQPLISDCRTNTRC